MSKRIVSIAFLICITFSTNYALGSDNLVLNGGYENWVDGLPERFTKIGADGLVEPVDSDPKSGNFSVKISHAKKATTYIYQKVAMEPETNYLLTCWIKGDNIVASGTFGGQIRIYDEGGNKLIYEGKSLVGTFGWREYKMIFNSGSHSAFRFMAPMLTVATGAIYADDLSIRPLAADDLDISIEPQIIPADGETSSIVEVSCSNLFSNLLLRVASSGIKMLDLNDNEISEIPFDIEEGKVSFMVIGTSVGDYPIEFSLDGGITWSPFSDFQQVRLVSSSADPNKSTIEANYSVRAAGGDQYPVTITVNAKLADESPAKNQIVTLNKVSGPDVKMSQTSKMTNDQGIATFMISSTKAGTVIIEAEVDSNNGLPAISINERLEIEFLQAVSTINSSVAFPNGVMVADGTTTYPIEILLQDWEEQPVTGRVISFDVGPEDLFLVTPLDATTDGQGQATLFLKSKIASAIPIKGHIQITTTPNESSEPDLTLADAPLEFTGELLESVFPENLAEDVGIKATFELVFHESIELQPGTTKISVTPEEGNQEQSVALNETYVADSSSWTVIGKKLFWRHDSLTMDIWYTVKLEGLRINEETVYPIIWRFKTSLDTTPPEIEIVNGHYNVLPLPWEAEVELSPQVKIVFSEELQTNEMGLPDGLKIEVIDSKGMILPNERIKNLSYDILLKTVSFELGELKNNETYSVYVSGAQDFAGLEMIPGSWSFTTIPSVADSLRIIEFEYEKNIFAEALVSTDLTFYFNKSLLDTPEPTVVVTSKTGEDILGTTTFFDYLGSKALVFTPTSNLSYDAEYIITFENVVDESGNNLVSESLTIITEVLASDLIEVSTELTEYVFTVPQEDGGGVTINISVPKGIVQPNIKLQVRNTRKDDTDKFIRGLYNNDLGLLPNSFQLLMMQENIPVTHPFSSPVLITLPYQDTATGILDIQGRAIPETSLVIYRWEEQTEEWIPVGGTVDVNANTISVEITNFGIYGIVGTALLATEYLNVVLTNNPIAPNSAGIRKETTFKFSLGKDSKVTLTLYDIQGRIVESLLTDEFYPAGYHGFSWDGKVNGKVLRSGLYLFRLFARTSGEYDPDVNWVSGVLGIKN